MPGKTEPVRFEILGPLRVIGSSDEAAALSRLQAIVLALLLLNANRMVPVPQLIDAIWDERPPSNARNQVQVCVSRLRKQLTEAGVDGHVVRTERAGYLVRTGESDLDALEFRRLLKTARKAATAGSNADASRHYRSALALWRGPALADVEVESVRRAAAALDEEQLQAHEECVRVELALGKAGELVGELTDLVNRHPYRESLHGALILALYRAGRQGDALAAYRRLRQLLHDELGTEPSAELRQLHQAILKRDPALNQPPPTRHQPVAPELPVPEELPADVAGFTGRVEALRALDEMLADGAGTAPATMVISAIAGTAGVGKTALAVHWAHRVASRFPDGQLYLNLRGFEPGMPPMNPADAVRALLDSLQVPPQRVPASLDAQVGLYRSVLARRRMLIVLDNARDAEQVRPLLPGSAASLAVVTSRSTLLSLAATHGAHLLTLELLREDEAREFLARRVGAQRIVDEPAAVADIIDGCAGLPLALAIAAARAAGNPHRSLTALASELRATGERLDALSAGDAATNPRVLFSLSYETLSPDAGRLFRLLALHPGSDIGVGTAVSLAGQPERQVRHLLDELVHAHLIMEPILERYAFHDLLRAYAAELVHTDPERREATVRLLGYYAYTADAAHRLLYSHRRQIEPALPLPRPGPAEVVDADQAIGWLETERTALRAAVAMAASTDNHAHAWHIAWSTAEFRSRRGYWHEQINVQHAAAAAARQLADPFREGIALVFLGDAHSEVGRPDEALPYLQAAVERLGAAGDARGQASAHGGLSLAHERAGRLSEAVRHAQRALELYRAAGQHTGEANLLNVLGWIHARLGAYDQAIAYCEQALSLQQRLGNRAGEADAWDSLGYTFHRRGDHRKAIACLSRALDMFRDLGDRYPQAETLTHLGDAHQGVGDRTSAYESWQYAFAILDELGHPYAEGVRARLNSK